MYFGAKYLSEPTLLDEAYCDFVYEGADSINIDEYLGILNEKMDMDEGYGSKLRPIYVILLYSDSTFDHVMEKFVKDQQYWHAAISFGPGLTHCYSFNFGEANANKFKGGLSFESIKFYQEGHPTGTMQVGAVFVSQEKYKKVKEALDFYHKNKEKTKYSFLNLIYSWLGKPTKNGLNFSLVCSTFVDTLLKHAHINLNDKQTNLVKPDDLKYTDEKKNYFKVYEGKIINYNAEEVQEKSEKLANRISNEFFKKSEDKEVEDIVKKKAEEKKAAKGAKKNKKD